MRKNPHPRLQPHLHAPPVYRSKTSYQQDPIGRIPLPPVGPLERLKLYLPSRPLHQPQLRINAQDRHRTRRTSLSCRNGYLNLIRPRRLAMNEWRSLTRLLQGYHPLAFAGSMFPLCLRVFILCICIFAQHDPHYRNVNIATFPI